MRTRCGCQSRAALDPRVAPRSVEGGRHESKRRSFAGLRSLKFCRRPRALATAQGDTAPPRPAGKRLARRGAIPISRASTRTTTRPGTPMERPDEFEGLTLADDHAREDRRDRRGARSALQSAGRQRSVAQQHLAAAAFDLRHVRPQQQTPVAHHRPRRRQDPGAHGRSRRAAARAAASARTRTRAGRSTATRHGSLRSLHHARHPELDDAGRVRQPLRDRPGARHRRDPLRDDSRGARDSARSPPAHRGELEAIPGRRARLVGRRHARRRDDELPRRDCAAALERERQDDRALQAHGGRHRRVDRDVRGREHVGAAVDVLDAAGASRPHAAHLRVRVPRRQSRDAQHPERRARRGGRGRR